MAEIKSTLDLVLERTRHLSMTDEEKAGQRKKDYEKRLQGLLQKYSDGGLSVDDLREDLAALQHDLQVDDAQPVLQALAAWIDPDGDNERWLLLVEVVKPPALKAVRTQLAAYTAKRGVLLASNGRRQRDRLLSVHGIGGSAVVPNPAADKACRQNLDDLKRETECGIAEALQAKV